MASKYTPEQAHQVKNLKVSNNILKKDIEKLNIAKESETEANVLAAIDTKIAYKLNRIAEKQAKIEAIEAEVKANQPAPAAE